MFRKISFIGLAILFAAGFCQEENTLSDGFVGVGPRATAMGGAHIALAQDFSACYYNPAGLAYVYKHELSGGLMVRSGNSETTLNSGAAKSTVFSMVKLNGLGFVMPVPAKQGGAAFAMGYSRSQSFDHTCDFNGVRLDGASIDAVETSDGGMGEFQIAGAIQASKYVAFGASVDILFGAENYTWDATISGFDDSTVVDSIISDRTTNDYTGATMRLGMTIMPTNFLSMGLLIKLPSMITYDQEYIQETTVGYTDGIDSIESIWQTEDDIELTTPFQFGGGIAVRMPFVNVAGDIVFTDWRQMRYHSSYRTEYNPWIPDSFHAVLSFGVGAEFTVPIKFLPTRLRAGYRYDPLPRRIAAIDKERQAITGGIAFLIDKSWLLEGAVVMSNWEKTTARTAGTVGEQYKIYDIYLGLAYRF